MIWWILCDVCLFLAVFPLGRIGWWILKDQRVRWKTTAVYVLLILAAYSFGALWLSGIDQGSSPPPSCSRSAT